MEGATQHDGIPEKTVVGEENNNVQYKELQAIYHKQYERKWTNENQEIYVLISNSGNGNWTKERFKYKKVGREFIWHSQKSEAKHQGYPVTNAKM